VTLGLVMTATPADAHLTKIEEQLSKHEGNRRVFEKHTWLKDYHVRTMQTL
jgi:hypothetical protein